MGLESLHWEEGLLTRKGTKAANDNEKEVQRVFKASQESIGVEHQVVVAPMVSVFEFRFLHFFGIKSSPVISAPFS